MLHRIETDGVVFYRSPLLSGVGVPHAFSTRLGGVSSGPFASLNLGNPSGAPVQDDRLNITENYRRLQRAIGCESRARLFAHQVHGAAVVDPQTAPVTDRLDGGCELGRADALTTADPSALVSVRVADCVPVLLASRDGRRVAAVHAGWRGVIAGVATAALASFDDAREVVVAIGPCISLAAFEVGLEVLDAFQTAFGNDAPFRRSDSDATHAYIDLPEALSRQLRRAGVPAAQIDRTDRCTFAHADEFFSHRRDQGVTGRMAALVGPKA